MRLPACFLALAGLPLGPSAGSVAAAPAPATAPLGQSQCFQAQYLLRLPNLESLHFIRDVESLGAVADDDDVTGDRRVVALSEEATDLRRDEARSFARLAALLKGMAAPPDLQAWAAARADGLAGPLPLTKGAKRDAKTSPQVVALLATLDECDALKSDADAHLTAVAAWINLTHGAAGLWAGDVGEATAALHVAQAGHEAPRLTTGAIRLLARTAPASAPAAVRDALTRLIPAGGNLSGLVPGGPVTADPQAVSQAQDALLAAFRAQDLVSVDAKAN